MDYTVVITILLLFVAGYFVYTIIQRQRQFQQICSDDHLYEIRDIFAELYEEVWEEFLRNQKEIEDNNDRENTDQETINLDKPTDRTSQQNNEDKTKYRLTSKNFLITYTVTPIQLKNKKLIIDHLSFSSVNQFFFPRNLVYMAVYFSILLDVKPETFDYVVHQANKGTSGFLFCKSDRNGELEQHKKNLCLLMKSDSEQSSIDDNVVEELAEEKTELNANSINSEEIKLQQDFDKEESIDQRQEENKEEAEKKEEENKEEVVEEPVVKLSLKELRVKIEELSPHIQIQKV